MNSPHRERIKHHIRSAVKESKYSPILGTFANIKKTVMQHGHGYFNDQLVEDLIKEELKTVLKK